MLARACEIQHKMCDVMSLRASKSLKRLMTLWYQGPAAANLTKK